MWLWGTGFRVVGDGAVGKPQGQGLSKVCPGLTEDTGEGCWGHARARDLGVGAVTLLTPHTSPGFQSVASGIPEPEGETAMGAWEHVAPRGGGGGEQGFSPEEGRPGRVKGGVACKAHVLGQLEATCETCPGHCVEALPLGTAGLPFPDLWAVMAPGKETDPRAARRRWAEATMKNSVRSELAPRSPEFVS